MKSKLPKTILSLAAALGLAVTAFADPYVWVPDNTLTLQPTSGTLDYTAGVLSNFSFNYDGFANPATSFTGIVTVLGNGHLMLGGAGLGGTSSGVGDAPTITWYNTSIGPTAENYGNVSTTGIHPAGPIFGNWVLASVPDGASALLLLGGAMLGLAWLRRRWN